MNLYIKEIEAEHLNGNVSDFWVGFGIGSGFVIGGTALGLAIIT